MKLSAVGLWIVATYCFLLIFLFVFQRNLQYVPSGEVHSPASYDLKNFEEKFLTSSDQKKLLAWYHKPRPGKKIILYFHGNAGNLGSRAAKFAALSRQGFGLFAVSYRGYSGSEGSPNEMAIISDAKMSLAFLLAQGYDYEDIILFGESLGSGVAVQIAAEKKFAAIVLEAPYSSISSVAQRRYWFAPVSILLKDRFESIKFASKISSPTLIIHGDADRVVPYDEGQKLFAAISAAQKKLITVEGADHLKFDNDFVAQAISDFLKTR